MNKFIPFLLILLLASGCFIKASAQELNRARIIEFYSEWCKNCDLIKPALQKMKKKYQDRLDLVEIDIADPANREMMRNYPILALPALAFQKPNGSYSMLYGYNTDEQIGVGTRDMLK